jgi:hypothetical protein
MFCFLCQNVSWKFTPNSFVRYLVWLSFAPSLKLELSMILLICLRIKKVSTKAEPFKKGVQSMYSISRISFLIFFLKILYTITGGANGKLSIEVSELKNKGRNDSHIVFRVFHAHCTEGTIDFDKI